MRAADEREEQGGAGVEEDAERRQAQRHPRTMPRARAAAGHPDVGV